jgi:hypothetical protein
VRVAIQGLHVEHHAMVFAVAATARRHSAAGSVRAEERREHGQAEYQQQRNGEDAAHVLRISEATTARAVSQAQEAYEECSIRKELGVKRGRSAQLAVQQDGVASGGDRGSDAGAYGRRKDRRRRFRKKRCSGMTGCAGRCRPQRASGMSGELCTRRGWLLLHAMMRTMSAATGRETGVSR